MPIVLIALITAAMTPVFSCETKETAVNSQHHSETVNRTEPYPVATFAGGCFWGVEHNFRRVPGVLATQVGFMGGHVKNPTYRQVCYEDTGHAEVVHLRYDPNTVSYEQLVRIFFKLHDPTTPNRQGPDIGPQYRSAIFTHTPDQRETARQVKARLDEAKAFRRPIVTEITPADTFWMAEDYHQQYIEKNPARRCHMVDFQEIKKILREKE